MTDKKRLARLEAELARREKETASEKQARALGFPKPREVETTGNASAAAAARLVTD